MIHYKIEIIDLDHLKKFSDGRWAFELITSALCDLIHHINDLKFIDTRHPIEGFVVSHRLSSKQFDMFMERGLLPHEFDPTEEKRNQIKGFLSDKLNEAIQQGFPKAFCDKLYGMITRLKDQTRILQNL